MKTSSNSKQALANRENAKKSTGPKTAQGKQAASWNALKHGMLAKAVLLNVGEFEEDPEELTHLLEELQADLKPEGMLEKILVEKIATCYWRLRRVMKAEQGEIDNGLINKRFEEISHMEFCEQLALAQGSSVYCRRLLRTVEGIGQLWDVLKKVREDVVNNGFVTEQFQRLLNVYFGNDRPGVAKYCEHHSKIAKENLELSKLDPSKKQTCEGISKECQEKLLTNLDKLVAKLEAGYFQVANEENCQEGATVARHNLPSQEASLKILRYETTIERELYQAMDKLEQLQSSR